MQIAELRDAETVKGFRQALQPHLDSTGDDVARLYDQRVRGQARSGNCGAGEKFSARTRWERWQRHKSSLASQ